MKVLAAVVLMVAYSIAEPPVDNRYLPPQQGFSGTSSLSQTYGAPGFGSQRQTNAIFRSPSSNYGAPARSRRPTTYSAPSRTNTYLPPRQSYQPSTQYSAPSTQYSAPSTQYNAPSTQYSAPSTQYGAPALGQSPSTAYTAPSTQYGAPSFDSASSRAYSAPSQQYGAPGFGERGFNQISRGDLSTGSFSSQQTRQYLPPGGSATSGYNYGRSSYDDGSNGEPANYSFEYMVKDDASGNDFGHRESRQGDRAEGLYYVLLPDGRKQTVEYEADQDGYKPKISYEDTGLGYDRNTQALGYQNQFGSGPY